MKVLTLNVLWTFNICNEKRRPRWQMLHFTSKGPEMSIKKPDGIILESWRPENQMVHVPGQGPSWMQVFSPAGVWTTPVSHVATLYGWTHILTCVFRYPPAKPKGQYTSLWDGLHYSIFKRVPNKQTSPTAGRRNYLEGFTFYVENASMLFT